MMIVTHGHAFLSVFGALVMGSLSGSVAVAIGALVVVLAIVLVFVMLFRSSGKGAQRTASGLGYDAQQGPLGQPQNTRNSQPWQQPQQPSWGAQDDFSTNGVGPGSANAGRGSGAGWGQTQDFAGGAMGAGGPAAQGQARWDDGANQPGGQRAQGGGWNDAAARGAGAGWNAPAITNDDQWPSRGGTPGAWNAPQGPASRPLAGGGQGGWNEPASAGRGGWDNAPAQQSAAPWSAPDVNAPVWGATPGAGAASEWGMNAPAGNGGAPEWGAAPAWNAQPSQPSGAQDWNVPAAGRPQQPGFDAAIYGAEADKTRNVRPAGGQRAGMIVVRQGKEPGRIFEVRKERLTIGRSRESDIFLEDLAVSRLHTTVSRDDGGRYLLRDEGSANGTYVNGQRVGEHVLEEGDEIQVGQTVLAFVRR